MASKSDGSKLKNQSGAKDKNTTKSSLLPESIQVIGMTPGGNEAGREVVLSIHLNGHNRIYGIPTAELAIGDKKSLATALVETEHFELVGRHHLAAVALSLLRIAKKNIAIVLSTPGRHEIEVNEEVFNAYVWGKDIYWFGKEPDAKIIVANSCSYVEPSCTLDEWKSTVGAKLTENPYLIVAHAHTLSAPIRQIFGQPHTTLSLVGPSGIGKSTAQQSAQSQIGPIDGVITMSGTKIGLLEYLAERPDQPVFFQDIRQVDSVNNFIELVFDVADGASRLRSGPKLRKSSATMILSNERTMADMAHKYRGALDEGVYARLIEIVCCGEYGAFHHLHGYDSPSDFANSLTQNSKENYGAIWPSWIHALAEDWEKIQGWYERWPQKIRALIVQEVGEAACERVNNRILDALVFSAWAGAVAAKLGIFPISRKEIISSFSLVMSEHLSRQLAGTTPLGEQVISKVRGFLDENMTRFPDLETFQETPHTGVSGYRWKTKRHGEIFLFLPHAFNRKFKAEFGSIVYEILNKAGFLVTNSDRGNQFQVRIPGTDERKSFVAIKASIRFD